MKHHISSDVAFILAEHVQGVLWLQLDGIQQMETMYLTVPQEHIGAIRMPAFEEQFKTYLDQMVNIWTMEVDEVLINWDVFDRDPRQFTIVLHDAIKGTRGFTGIIADDVPA